MRTPFINFVQSNTRFEALAPTADQNNYELRINLGDDHGTRLVFPADRTPDYDSFQHATAKYQGYISGTRCVFHQMGGTQPWTVTFQSGVFVKHVGGRESCTTDCFKTLREAKQYAASVITAMLRVN